MKILGISCYYHDAASCLVVDGKVLAATEEERFTRKKHDSGFPENSIKYCLNFAKITSADLDYIVFYEKPFLKLERLFLTILQTYPQSRNYFQKTVATWLLSKMWIRGQILEKLNINDERKVLFIPHHLSHAASCFIPSGFKEAAILTNDGVGEWTTSAWGYGTDKKITISGEMRFPHSLGLLYATLTAFLGFEVNEGEYKVMGLAGFGQPTFVPEIMKIFTLFTDGSLKLDLAYFDFQHSPDRMYSDKLVELLGNPRVPSSPFFTRNTALPTYYEKQKYIKKYSQDNQKYADIAASLQKITEEIILTQVRYLWRETRVSRLCLAGGVALNGVANGRIVRETPMKHLFIQPAAGDSGGAMGAALYTSRYIAKEKNSYVLSNAYLGPSYSDLEIIKSIKDNNLSAIRYTRNKLLDLVVNNIAKGKVVGWFQGRLEWGPRALGNRSILADPRQKAMKDIINVKIKFREPFRPFAPVVIASKAKKYFDLPNINTSMPAKFMTVVANVKKVRQNEIPAVTHVDGTGRLQVIDRSTNPLYYDLVRLFGAKTRTHVLLNTSFNLKGEPIVCSPNDAISTFLRSGIDILVLGNYVVKKQMLT